MARRRDPRAFGGGPYLLGLRRYPDKWGPGFPYDVPAVAACDQMSLAAPVTLLAGDNGTGKSTLIEAIGEAIGFAPEGGELERPGEPPARPRKVMGDAVEPVLSETKPRTGHFLRAESFFNIAAVVDSGGRFAPDLSLYGSVGLHACARGSAVAAAVDRSRRRRPKCPTSRSVDRLAPRLLPIRPRSRK
jgi:predicted ATPase